MKKTKQMSESYILGIILAVVGGYLDAYTYLTRGGIFANAQTGNIVLLSIKLAQRDIRKAVSYLIPISAFAIGVLVAEFFKIKLKHSRLLHWRQLVIVFELILLFAAAFLPQGRADIIVTTTISFVCAMQVEGFRSINSNTVATTMCTGNLRSATQLLFYGIRNKDKKEIVKSFNYYGIIFFFMLGAVAGVVITDLIGVKSIIICSVFLMIPFFMMFKTKI